MNRKNKTVSILLCVLIVLSAANFALTFSNTLKIKQLENAPAVVIDTTPATTQSTSAERIVVSEPELSTETSHLKETTAAEESTSENQLHTDEYLTDTTEEKTTVTTTEKASEESTQDSSGYCFVTASGTKYHREGCSYLKKSKTKMTVTAAESSGYSPCSRCY